jgi:dolichol-phosphate mannosyltransferase
MTEPSRTDLFVSVVAPVRNDGDIVAAFIRDTTQVMRSAYTHWEIILVDDASTDDTVSMIEPLLSSVESLRLIRLSRSFGTEIAISAGLETAIGDFVVVMEPATDPPEAVPTMVEHSRSGAAIVFGIRRSRRGEPWYLRLGAPLFFRACNSLLRLDLPENSTHFRVLSRQAVNAALQIKDRNRYLRTLGSFVGYMNHSVEYEPIRRRESRRSKSLAESIGVALGIVVSNSLNPLRLVVWFGVLLVVANLGYLGFVAAIYLFKKDVAAGWTTESALMATMFGSISLMLTVVAAYVGRLLEESGDRPIYFVQEERTSSVQPQEVMNVVSDTTGRHSVG